VESVRLLRADQVGSLLRPPALLEARAAQQAGRLSEADLAGLRTKRFLPLLRRKPMRGNKFMSMGDFGGQDS
jgi:5-methyltetrahydropteroyltriglutamate--homocysteine methyltransferase